MMAVRLSKIDEAILTRMRYVGEQFVKNARESQTYTDRTGNLRNSIGYIIMKDGKQIYENFRRTANTEQRIQRGKAKGQTKKSKGSKEGVNAGKKIAQEAAAEFPTGYVLIGVAGMEYAAAVERKGFDVITASAKIAELAMEQAIAKISEKIKRMR